jgi:hypothetical protein
MALKDIEIYMPPGIDPERIRIRRVNGESEPAFRAVEDLPQPSCQVRQCEIERVEKMTELPI